MNGTVPVPATSTIIPHGNFSLSTTSPNNEGLGGGPNLGGLGNGSSSGELGGGASTPVILINTGISFSSTRNPLGTETLSVNNSMIGSIQTTNEGLPGSGNESVAFPATSTLKPIRNESLTNIMNINNTGIGGSSGGLPEGANMSSQIINSTRPILSQVNGTSPVPPPPGIGPTPVPAFATFNPPTNLHVPAPPFG